MGFAGQTATADAKARAYEQNVVLAQAAARDSQNAITLRQIQEAGATSQAVHLNELDQARREAVAIAAGEQKGIGGGINLDNLVADIGGRMEQNRLTYITNWNDRAAQLQRSKDATLTAETSRINSLDAGTPPSILEPLGKVAGGGLRFFGDLERQDRPIGDQTFG